MWGFLATEILFFGGLFFAYTVYRWSYPLEFAEIARETNVLFGTLNTGILLTSSLTMALGVHEAEEGKSRRVGFLLAITALLGVAFMVVKGFEYHEDFEKNLLPGLPAYSGASGRPQDIFLLLYYTMTGVHALHLTIGIGVVLWMAHRAFQSEFSDIGRHHVIQVAGLYWHFVDGIWVVLYPLIYLVDRYTP